MIKIPFTWNHPDSWWSNGGGRRGEVSDEHLDDYNLAYSESLLIAHAHTNWHKADS